MKELVIIVGTILLGCIIFNMIVGEDNSLKSEGKKVMEQTIQMYEENY